MRFSNDREETITDLRAWKALAGPVSGDQWKPDRSAQELARDWIERDAQARAEALLSLHPGLAPVALDSAIAEHRTRFDEIPRGPRNHDLLAIGTGGPGRLVVGIEGKADESFGETLARYRDRERSKKSRALERLDRLTDTLFGNTLAHEPTLCDLRYQLCSALAGTLADAKSAEAVAAVLLIHEFRTTLTDDRRHQANSAALEAFVSRLPGEPSRYNGTGGWVAGPWTVRAESAWLPASMSVFVGKLVTNLDKPS